MAADFVRVIARTPGDYQPRPPRERETGTPLVERILDLLADPVTKSGLAYDGHRLTSEFSGDLSPS